MLEGGVDLERGCAFAADHGFEFVELNAEGQFHRTRVDPGTVRECVLDAVERVSTHGRERGVEPVAENLKSPFFDAGDFPLLFDPRTRPSVSTPT